MKRRKRRKPILIYTILLLGLVAAALYACKDKGTTSVFLSADPAQSAVLTGGESMRKARVLLCVPRALRAGNFCTGL